MSNIRVSVVIPTYRREQLVLEAIGSVLAQTEASIEVLVLDDSPEGTAEFGVRSIPDPRVRYIKRVIPSHGRPALVRNEGAKLASGRYLYFLDDDDLLEVDALSALAAELDAHSEAAMAFGAIIPFGPDPDELRRQQSYFRRSVAVARSLRSRMQFIANMLFYPTLLVNSACMGRRETFLSLGGYDVDIPVCEDVELWMRMARHGGFRFLDRPVVRYRTGMSSLMHDLEKNDERLVFSWRKMIDKYRAMHGTAEVLGLKLWARTLLRFQDQN